jgi:thiol-disulfide isomerase/thioredoxin
MKKIIKEGLSKGQSYKEYRTLVNTLVEHNSTSGSEKTKDLVEYTKLNDKRMKRWDKTLKIPENSKSQIKTFKSKVTWLVITESWCGDAAHILPVINKVAELNNNITLRIVLRDENKELMNQFLTNGNQSIPKLIMIAESTGEVINTYGPRPNLATKIVNDFKAENGKLTPEFKQDLQMWYNKDKGQSIVEDLTKKLCELEPIACL